MSTLIGGFESLKEGVGVLGKNGGWGWWGGVLRVDKVFMFLVLLDIMLFVYFELLILKMPQQQKNI